MNLPPPPTMVWAEYEELPENLDSGAHDFLLELAILIDGKTFFPWPEALVDQLRDLDPNAIGNQP